MKLFLASTATLLSGLLHLIPQTARAENEKDGFKLLITETNRADSYVFLGRGALPADTNSIIQVSGTTIHMYGGQANGKPQCFGYIATKKEYSNFHLRFEYQWGTNRFGSRVKAKRDAGVIYHMFGPDAVWPSGVECQVQETDVGDIFTVNCRISTTVDPATTNLSKLYTTNANGSVRTTTALQPQFLGEEDGGIRYVQGKAEGIFRVIRNPMNERAGWNTVDLIVRHGTASYLVNGKVNNRIKGMERFVDGKWVSLTQGKIMFQLEGAEVFYRNIELKELKP